MPMTEALAMTDLPLYLDVEVACPAGVPIGITPTGSGCRCKIAHETITTAANPKSLLMFCMSGYRQCPTWQAEKARVESGVVAPLIRETDAE